MRNKIIIILILIAILIVALIGIADAKDIRNLTKRIYEQDKRIEQLEIDYKIYDMNLKQLEENKSVQFGE